MKIYYVGNSKDETGTTWELQGIFENKVDAINAIKDAHCEDCFISSITLNKMYPLETLDRREYDDIGFYPLLEDEK